MAAAGTRPAPGRTDTSAAPVRTAPSVRGAPVRGCGQDRALPGLRPGDGVPICTTCAGFSRTFDCSRCGFEGKLLGGRLCERCTLSDRLTALLDDGTGRIRPALVPLFNLLVAMDKPNSGLAWLAMRRSQPTNASRLLQQLGLGQISLTHDAFHELQPWRTAAHLEELLMTSGVLPTVDKYLCSFQRWPPRTRQNDQALRDLARPPVAAGPRRTKPHHTQRPEVRRRPDQVRDRLPAMARPTQQQPRVLRPDRHRRLVGREQRTRPHLPEGFSQLGHADP